MIKSKDGKTIFSENAEETAWFNMAEGTKFRIERLKNGIKQAKEDLKMSDRQIAKQFREGAKKVMKKYRTEMKLEKELLKFCEGHYENAL